MLFGPQRGSAFTILDKFASSFVLPMVVFFLALIFGNMEDLLQNGIAMVVVFFAPFARLFQYLFTYYSIDEENFYVKKGLFNKKKLELPLDRITTVDFTQNLFFQWLGVYSIKVDNASNYGGKGAGKVELALKTEDALRVKALLLSKRAEKEDKSGAASQAYNGAGSVSLIPVRNILLMGALQAKGNAIAQIISIVMVFAGMVNTIIGSEYGFEEGLINIVMSIPGIGMAAILVVMFIVISTVLGAFFALIKYYGFRIKDGEKSIYLEYGLLTKKNHSLLKERISGVEFVQSLPMRFFKVGYLNVMAVGYGDDKSGEKALLYPLIMESESEKFVYKYIPEIDQVKEYDKPLKRSLRYFFYCPRFALMVLLTVAMIILEVNCGFIETAPLNISWIWILLGFVLLLMILSVIVEYKNTAVCAGEKNVRFISGGFTRVKTAVKTPMIESVSNNASILKRRKGVISIKMGILAPALDSVKKVRNMHMQAFENLRNVIHY